MAAFTFWLYSDQESRVVARATEEGLSRNDWLRNIAHAITAAPDKPADPPLQVNIYLDRKTILRLHRISKDSGISTSALMRRVIDRYLG
jgi:hypothetical protein